MKKLIALTVFAAAGAPALVTAAPPGLTCPADKIADATKQPGGLDATDKANFDESGKDATKFKDTNDIVWDRTLDCFRDEVLVLDGDKKNMAGKALFTCADKSGMAGVPDPANCHVDAQAAADRALEVMGGQVKEWDQLVVFGANIQPSSSSNRMGPLFIREGFARGATPADRTQGVSDVGGIGLTKTMRNAMRPWVGIINAGSTGSVSNAGKGEYTTCGTAPRRDTDTHVPYTNMAGCFPKYYTYFDALAQQTGALYGPYLGEFDAGGMARELASLEPTSRTKVNETAAGKPAYNVRVWNAFFNTRGSIFAGNTWRDNGNGTWELTKPTPYYGANPPYGRPGNETGISAGAQVLRFQPLDLYLLGFLPLNQVGPDLLGPAARMQFFAGVTSAQVYRPVGIGALPADMGTIGPGMGIRGGIAIRPAMVDKTYYAPEALLQGAVRDPAPEAARQYIRQLWVVVTRPKEIREEGFKAASPADPFKDAKAKAKLVNDAFKQVDNVQIWRRQWNHYFYMLSGYKGRVTTTFDADVSDAAYFEFGDADDDPLQFSALPGVTLEKLPNGKDTSYQWEVVNQTEWKNTLKITSTDGMGGIRFNATNTAKVPKLKIDSDQNIKWPTNAVTVRMKVAEGAVPRGSYAEIEFTGGAKPVILRIPSTCGNNPNATDAKGKPCNEAGTLVPDGKWRNYSAALNVDLGKDDQGNVIPSEFVQNGPYTGFTFYPSNVQSEETLGPAFEIEFIRISNVASASDKDFACDQKTPQPDGWVDSEDNCKAAYNPDQADSNDDGVGDACEDFDGDGIINQCDNCPTLTNSRQKDSDGDKFGDVCDGGTPGSCFLTPESIGGRLASRPTAFGSLFFLAMAGLFAARRFRRK